MTAPPIVLKSMSFEGPRPRAPAPALPAMAHDLLGRRIAAAMIDQTLVFGAYASAVVLAGLAAEPTDGPSVARVFMLILAAPLVPLLVEILTGRSLGKRALGLRVIRADDGRRPGVWRMTVRTALLLGDLLPGCSLVGLLLILTSERGQRLGDLAARTVVVRHRP